MTELDREIQAARAALVYRIRQRDAAIHAAENDIGDAEVFALEFMTALMGRGWRPTNTGPAPVHAPGAGLPKREDAVAAVAELKAQLAPRDGDAA